MQLSLVCLCYPYLNLMCFIPDVQPQFADLDQTDPNCVVLGDAQEHFTYKNMNQAFQILLGCQDPVLIAMGGGCVSRTPY